MGAETEIVMRILMGNGGRKKQSEKECMQVTDKSNVKMNNTINPVITYSNLIH